MSAENFLPVDTFKDAAEHLRRPFSPNAVRFKIQTQFGGKKNQQGRYEEPPTGGLIVAYIDARLVAERLNRVCPHLWHDHYDLVSLGQGGGRGLMACHLTIDGITRIDVGEGMGKGLYSDAFKRAAVKFGVGVSLYAVPQVILNAGSGARGLKVRKNGLTLTDENLAALRKGYGKWLKDHGEEAFGPALDHGDSQDATGDPTDPDAQEPDVEDEPVEQESAKRPPKAAAKVKPARVKALAQAFAETTREDVTPDDLKVKLGQMTGQRVTDPDEVMRSLKDTQADELEAWIKEQAA